MRRRDHIPRSFERSNSRRVSYLSHGLFPPASLGRTLVSTIHRQIYVYPSVLLRSTVEPFCCHAKQQRGHRRSDADTTSDASEDDASFEPSSHFEEIVKGLVDGALKLAGAEQGMGGRIVNCLLRKSGIVDVSPCVPEFKYSVSREVMRLVCSLGSLS